MISFTALPHTEHVFFTLILIYFFFKCLLYLNFISILKKEKLKLVLSAKNSTSLQNIRPQKVQSPKFRRRRVRNTECPGHKGTAWKKGPDAKDPSLTIFPKLVGLKLLVGWNFFCPIVLFAENSRPRILKILPRNLNKIVRSWIRLQDQDQNPILFAFFLFLCIVRYKYCTFPSQGFLWLS